MARGDVTLVHTPCPLVEQIERGGRVLQAESRPLRQLRQGAQLRRGKLSEVARSASQLAGIASYKRSQPMPPRRRADGLIIGVVSRSLQDAPEQGAVTLDGGDVIEIALDLGGLGGIEILRPLEGDPGLGDRLRNIQLRPYVR